jgi:hypothetical protein
VVEKFSSPLFSHVTVDLSKDTWVIPRWANALFVVTVVGVFAYCGGALQLHPMLKAPGVCISVISA